MSDFVEIADFLKLPEKDELVQQIVVSAVKRWLENHTDWLLILDNIEDLAILEDFIPSTNRGHILLTTRTQAMGNVVQHIPIEQMEEEEGALFLLRRASIIPPDALFEDASLTDRNKAKEILQIMGGLPLALDQAGAYIEETKCGLSNYLDFYRKRSTVLLKERGGPLTRQLRKPIVDHPEPIATTWSLSFEKVKQANHAAAERMWALLLTLNNYRCIRQPMNCGRC